MRGRKKSKSLLRKLLAASQQLTSQPGRSFVCICADCNKIRDNRGSWHEADDKVRESGLEFTHGFCPECLSQRNSEVEDFILTSRKR